MSLNVEGQEWIYLETLEVILILFTILSSLIVQLSPEGDTDWKLVRSIPEGQTWHPATDDLAGLDSYGDISNLNEPFSRPFSNMSFNQVSKVIHKVLHQMFHLQVSLYNTRWISLGYY